MRYPVDKDFSGESLEPVVNFGPAPPISPQGGQRNAFVIPVVHYKVLTTVYFITRFKKLTFFSSFWTATSIRMVKFSAFIFNDRGAVFRHGTINVRAVKTRASFTIGSVDVISGVIKLQAHPFCM